MLLFRVRFFRLTVETCCTYRVLKSVIMTHTVERFYLLDRDQQILLGPLYLKREGFLSNRLAEARIPEFVILAIDLLYSND